MMYFKKPKFSHLAVALSFLLVACDGNLIQEDQIDQATLEESATSKNFKLSELTEMTDYSNMRVGDFTGRFLILSKGPNLPVNLERSIQLAGGELVKSFPEIGVAVAVSRSGNFFEKASAISGIESITADMIFQFTKEPEFKAGESMMQAQEAGPPFNYQDAFFDGFQWAPGSIDAPKAWDAGYTGKGVRVAVIDGGIHSMHQDLAPNLDIASSVSTVPGLNFNEDTGTFWHGTHVAGIVAAAGLGVVGIAPQATIIGVKSLHSGSGAFEWVLEGMIYAATPQSRGGGGAQIINMSLGASIDYRTDWQVKDIRTEIQELQTMFDRATRYANQNGVTVIASSGNGETNYDDAKELLKLPAETQYVLSISSTGPTGWVLGNTNFSQPAYYTDYGKSLVDFAAPGGSVGLAIVEGNFSPCTLVATNLTDTRTCAVYDQVFSTVRGTTNGSYGWAQGTSMASPAVAGVVALMMQANGGHMTPAQVKTRLSQAATDLGKPGQDEFYGNGFVNAAKSVGIND